MHEGGVLFRKMIAGGIPVSVKHADNSEEGHARLEEEGSSSADFHAKSGSSLSSFLVLKRPIKRMYMHLSSHKVYTSLIPCITA